MGPVVYKKDLQLRWLTAICNLKSVITIITAFPSKGRWLSFKVNKTRMTGHEGPCHIIHFLINEPTPLEFWFNSTGHLTSCWISVWVFWNELTSIIEDLGCSHDFIHGWKMNLCWENGNFPYKSSGFDGVYLGCVKSSWPTAACLFKTGFWNCSSLLSGCCRSTSLGNIDMTNILMGKKCG